MSISAEEKNRYLRETAIVLAREEFHTDRTQTGGLCVLLDGAPLCEVTENGGITYESLWRRMVWKCGNDGFDFRNIQLGGIEPELYSVYQAAKAIAVGCCNITLADLASPELVTDEAFHLITGAPLMVKYGDVVLNLEKGVDET